MDFYIKNGANQSLLYRPHLRRYAIKEIHPHTTGVVSNAIDFCPWCGLRLLGALSVEWERILKEEFGITDLWSAKSKNIIPREFLTDEWWRIRNL